MLNKKFFAKAFALAMATGLMTVAAPAVAQAWATETTTTPAPAKTVSADIDYDNYSLTITPEEGDNYVFLAVVKKAGDEEKKWTIYPYAANNGDVTILTVSAVARERPDLSTQHWEDVEKASVTIPLTETDEL